MTTAEFVNTEIPRDRYGRPMIMPPNGKKRIPYRRTTTFVGCLDDTYGLMQWKQRQTALGMGQRPDLVLAAASTDPDDKRRLNEIADKACEHALASSAATTGTSLHALTERLDRGQKLGHVPDPYGNDLKAYEQATQHIEWLGIEAFRVHDDWKVAGTADRIGRTEGSERLRIFDIKTGSIDFPHKMAMQLAMYARSLPYDIPTDKRGIDPGEIDLNTGIIIHLPAGEGHCDLYEIDIAKGWGACLLAKQVWAWRGEKTLTHKIGEERVSTWEKCNDPRTFTEQVAQSYLKQIEHTTTLDELRELWRVATKNDAATPDFRAAAQKRSRELQCN